MTSIDLARLRKQTLRLADFFFAPDEFVRNFHTTLDSYVNYTVRTRRPARPGGRLPAHRTPPVVLRQIEQTLAALASASENAPATLALADRLWDEAWRETRLLAAYLLGQIPPQEAPVIARLTAWIGTIREPELRADLLETSLRRMRKNAPDIFLRLINEWARPERARLWPAALRAGIAAAKDPAVGYFPSLVETLEPVIRSAPAEMQLDVEELFNALFDASPTETTFLVRQMLAAPGDQPAAIVFRRMMPSLPAPLRDEIRELARGKSFSEA